MSYEHRGFVMSDEMEDGLRSYIDDGVEPGGFLSAVICNDLSEACARADHLNMGHLPAFVAFLYNEAPSTCWGSKAKMDAWLERHAERRQQEGDERAAIAERDRRAAEMEARGDYERDARKDPDFRRE